MNLMRVRFFKKVQDWILKSENEFLRFFILNGSIQGHSDHGASKEPKNLFPDSSVPVKNPLQE